MPRWSRSNSKKSDKTQNAIVETTAPSTSNSAAEEDRSTRSPPTPVSPTHSAGQASSSSAPQPSESQTQSFDASSRSSSSSTVSSVNSTPAPGQPGFISPLANRALLAAAAAEGVMPQVTRWGRVIPYTQEMEEATMPCLAYATARPTLASEDYGAPPPYFAPKVPSKKR